MAWIESHQDLRSNPKTKRAARQLGTTVPAVMGHLHCLWHWALDHAFSGDLSPFDPEDIAEAAEWDGDADTFVKVLTNCGPGDKAGFLEVDGPTAEGGCGLLVLHDWAEFTAHLRERREASKAANHERWHVKRKRPDPDCSLCTVPRDSERTPHGERSDSEGPPSGLHRPTDLPEPTEPEIKGVTSHGKPRSDRATRLPSGWKPSPEPELVAAIGGQGAAAREFEKFCDYWHAKAGKDGRKVSWQATWRNWLRRAGEDRGGGKANLQSHGERLPDGTMRGVM